MTLKELLLKVEFENVAPFILRQYPGLSHCMAGFRMAFDGMRNTTPSYNNDETIMVVRYNKDEIVAHHPDNDIWKNVVGREVYIADNVAASLEEVAAIILYDATFYGFTPDDRVRTFRKWNEFDKYPTNGNPYRIRWWRLTQRKHDSECQKKDIGTRYYTADKSIFWEKPMSRIKRMRAYRWKKRINELDKLAKRWDLLQEIRCSNPEADLAAFENLLFKAKTCQVSRREDFSAEGIGLPYIYELMNKYDSLYSKKADLTLMCIVSPHDIDTQAVQNISNLVSNPLIAANTNASNVTRTKLTIVQLFTENE